MGGGGWWRVEGGGMDPEYFRGNKMSRTYEVAWESRSVQSRIICISPSAHSELYPLLFPSQ